MSDLTFFEPDEYPAPAPPPHHPALPTSVRDKNLPADDFDVPAQDPKHTIYYLTIATPHTDTFVVRGPEPSFKILIPSVLSAASNSPTTCQKLETLRKDKAFRFDELGFSIFVIELERGAYSILTIVREVNEKVHDVLPCPVYVVTTHGPLEHDMGGYIRTVASGRPRGMASLSRLVGSWVDVRDARAAAKTAMDELVRGQTGVMRIEKHEAGGKKRHVFLAMSARYVWEVRVAYEEEALEVLKGVKGVWRC